MSGIKTALRTLAGSLLGPVWRRIWLRVEHRLAPIERRIATLDPMTDRIIALEAMTARCHRLEEDQRRTVARLDAVFPHVDAVADAMTGWGNRVIAMEALQHTLAARLTAIETAWRQHIPAFLNGVGTVSALAHALDEQRKRLDASDVASQAIRDRIEFARQEILFEMAHGASHTDTVSNKVASRIVDPGKLATLRAQGALRLNLGAGHIALPGYVNVDRRALPGIEVVAEADDLPFEPGSVDEIASAHLLEHVPNEAMRRRYLPHWLSLLRPGGVFRAVTPDAQAMLAAAAAGTYDFAEFREVLFGAQDYDGDYHYNIFTPDSLAALLHDAGLTGIEVPVAARRNGKCFEFEITARRP